MILLTDIPQAAERLEDFLDIIAFVDTESRGRE